MNPFHTQGLRMPLLIRLLMAAITQSASSHQHTRRTASGTDKSPESEASFLKILKENHGLITKICRSYTKQKADQEDLHQEIVFQLWKAYPDFRGDSKVSTWMYTLALRSCNLPFRRNRFNLSELTDNHPDRTANDQSLADDLDDKLFKFFHRLGNTDRSILVLVVEGYTYKEIGPMLKLSHYAVAQRISRIRKSLTNH